MAEGQVKQVLEKEVTCPLCLDLFKDPKKLPCDHVYCKDCLRGLALRSLNETISCPECRTLTQLPNNDVNNFPTAFRVNRLIEAFQQVQVREETDSPSITDRVCHTHPTQPLALYCETCKKQLCRDCLLMTQDHVNHKYAFFKEITPKYRQKLFNRLSLVKSQEHSISNALKEISTSENNLTSHSKKCQDEIDHAFDEMFSVMEECKQAMKKEAAAYYSSYTCVFDQQKDQLKGVHSHLREVTSLAEDAIKDDDQNFLTKLESTFTQIEDIKLKLQTVPLTVAKPPLLMTQVVSTEELQYYLKTQCSLCNLATSEMCTVEGAFLTNEGLYLNQLDEFIVTLNDSRGKICRVGDNRVEASLVNLQGNSTNGNVVSLTASHVKVTLTPQRRGQHKLNVKVNGAHITNSPFTVVVNMPPKLLSQPLATISGLGRPAGLIYSQGKILVTEMERNQISEVDSQHRVQIFKRLIRVGELTQDTDLNLYVTTVDHQLHKFSKDGRCIKTIGRLGSNKAEFYVPNGLRVSKELELYVCDSFNNRLQVFDLDLNFKRSFGRKGTGKGQFTFPSDVDFDSSGYVYIADHGNYRIQVFTCRGYHVRTIGNREHSAVVFKPVTLLMYNNLIYATDVCKNRVLVMTISGDIIATFGNGYLDAPEGITVDSDGFLYVTSHASKILIF